jgi:hypothetical protein
MSSNLLMRASSVDKGALYYYGVLKREREKQEGGFSHSEKIFFSLADSSHSCMDILITDESLSKEVKSFITIEVAASHYQRGGFNFRLSIYG